MRKAILLLLAFLALGAAVYGAVYWSALNGAPFRAARTYLMTLPSVVPSLGKVSEIRLLPFTSYYERTAGSKGEARFNVEVIGAKGKKTANVEMEMRDDVWKPRRVRIDGRVLPIEQRPD
jgi:hypothetical protein